MKGLFLSTCIFVALAGCGIAEIPVQQLVKDSDKWNSQLVAADGYLCVDLFTVYLASSSECGELKEEQIKEFKIFLWLDPELLKEARAIPSGSRVRIIGEFEGPPEGAIRETSGELAGYSMHVASIRRP